MGRKKEASNSLALNPPAGPPDDGRASVWFPLPPADPLTGHIASALWDQPGAPGPWQAARLSTAAYLYRESTTGWTVAAKFISAKTNSDAERHAARERDLTLQARAIWPDGGALRVVEPLGVWRGVLLLEYVPGLTLEDVIAIRRSQPGTLVPALELAAAFLTGLHAHSPEMEDPTPADFVDMAAGAHKLVATLSKHGVLQDEPVIAGALDRLIDRWAQSPSMRDYTPNFVHGDATTTNFVFPTIGSVVGIDWERAKVMDPAGDVGRLLAEVAHSITRHGGSAAEALEAVEVVSRAYGAACVGGELCAHLLERARFYQAASTLRIARNGWLTHLERTRLAAQALALLC